MRSIASERLQMVLNFWKNLCWYFETLYLTEFGGVPDAPWLIPGPITNWRRYDQVVFDNSFEELPFGEWDVPQERIETSYRSFSYHARFPFEFFEWSRKSRRVFHLPASLHKVFALATFPQIKWKEVLWPFDSFMITLEQPLLVEDEVGVWSQYDAILVSRLKQYGGAIHIRLIQQPTIPIDEYKVAENVNRRIQLFMKRGEKEKAQTTLKRSMDALYARIKSTPGWRHGVIYSPIDNLPDSRVKLEVSDFAARIDPETVARLEGGTEENLWRIEPMSWAAKIVVGWCLYHRTISATSLEWNEKKWKEHIPGMRGVTGIITNREHICTILGEATLNPDTAGRDTPSQNYPQSPPLVPENDPTTLFTGSGMQPFSWCRIYWARITPQVPRLVDSQKSFAQWISKRWGTTATPLFLKCSATGRSVIILNKSSSHGFLNF
jgi:hypothetical protein